MQDSGIVLYGVPRSVGYKPYFLTWCDGNGYDDALPSGEPLSSAQNVSYFLTYEEVDDYLSQSWFKNGGGNQDYGGNEIPYSGPGTCLGDYSSYFGCYWGENEVYTEKGCGKNGRSLDVEENNTFYGDDVHGGYFDCIGEQQQYYSESGLAMTLDFGAEDDVDEVEYSTSWCNWALYERIFGQ